MAPPIPIIVCGATQAVATQVKSNMLPEFDVVYAGFDLPATLTEVPQILSSHTSGTTPPAASTLHTQLGSNDFTTSGFPRAVIAGGGYTDEAFQNLFQACVQACGGTEGDAKLPVPFFRVDNGITSRLVAEGKMPAIGTPEYPAAIAGRLKERLREVGVVDGEGEGKQGNGGSVFMF